MYICPSCLSLLPWATSTDAPAWTARPVPGPRRRVLRRRCAREERPGERAAPHRRGRAVRRERRAREVRSVCTAFAGRRETACRCGSRGSQLHYRRAFRMAGSRHTFGLSNRRHLGADGRAWWPVGGRRAPSAPCTRGVGLSPRHACAMLGGVVVNTPRQQRRHHCGQRHSSWRSFAACAFPNAEWVAGEGRWASLARCGAFTVQLHDTLEGARAAQDFIDRIGCGHACGRYHTITELIIPAGVGVTSLTQSPVGKRHRRRDGRGRTSSREREGSRAPSR